MLGWYPGHMHKARRQIKDALPEIDAGAAPQIRGAPPLRAPPPLRPSPLSEPAAASCAMDE